MLITHTEESGHAAVSRANTASSTTEAAAAAVPITEMGSPDSMVHLGAPPPPPPPPRLGELTQPEFALSMSPIRRNSKKKK